MPRDALAAVALSLILSGNPGLVLAQATGKLNDTGIVLCANSDSNSITCSYNDTDTTGFPRQDGQLGRSPKDQPVGTLTKTGASASAGFDYQKLAYIGGGVVLAGTALGVTAGLWGCTKDVITGLIWDMKVTTASNIRLNTSTYNWKDSTASSNGGIAGSTGDALTCFGSNCDTEAYKAAINAIDADGAGAGTAGVCGETLNDWRLPTRLELMNIVDASKQYSGSATADSTYFPNLQAGRYWTSENLASNPNSARWVDLSSGSDGFGAKSNKYYVILVRP